MRPVAQLGDIKLLTTLYRVLESGSGPFGDFWGLPKST